MLLRLCGLLDVYDYGDCAIEILDAFRTTLLAGVDVDLLIDAVVPSLNGQFLPYDMYRQISIKVREVENQRMFDVPWTPVETGYKSKR